MDDRSYDEYMADANRVLQDCQTGKKRWRCCRCGQLKHGSSARGLFGRDRMCWPCIDTLSAKSKGTHAPPKGEITGRKAGKGAQS